MMTLQEIINFIESLPREEQDYLFEFLRKKKEQSRGDNFWQGLQKFRSAIQSEGLSLLIMISLTYEFAVWSEKSIYELEILT
jgi:hypothetical protein